MSIDIHVEDHVATVTLNRPESMNSYDAAMRKEAYAMWGRLRDDEDIHVAVITGAGAKAFCTGSDLRIRPPMPEKPEGAPDQVVGSAIHMMRTGFQTLTQHMRAGGRCDCLHDIVFLHGRVAKAAQDCHRNHRCRD